jgi:hypothetical protein
MNYKVFHEDMEGEIELDGDVTEFELVAQSEDGSLTPVVDFLVDPGNKRILLVTP